MNDRLVSFLYLLMRDELAFGRVEKLVSEVEKTDGKAVVFSEPRMSEYAASLAARLGNPRMARALQSIREAGHNTHPTSIWMQQVAAHALEPEKWPEPTPEPPASVCTCPPEETNHLAQCPSFESHQRSKGWGSL